MKFKKLFAAAVASVAFVATSSAHAGLFDNLDFSGSKRRLETYSKVLDKQLVDHFYWVAEDGKKEGLHEELANTTYTFRKLADGSLTVRKPFMIGDSLYDIVRAMDGFGKSPLDDEMGRRYVAFAKARGNTVHLYKPAMGAAMGSLFNTHFEFKPDHNIRSFFEAENALIEVAPDGRVVSLQMRAHQAIFNFTARSFQYVTFVFGKDYMQLFENKISNSFMSENFLRVVE